MFARAEIVTDETLALVVPQSALVVFAGVEKLLVVRDGKVAEQRVRTGQTVRRGDVVGTVGNTGNAVNTPPHLHYSVNTSPNQETGDVNPFVYLRTGNSAPEFSASYSTMPWTPADLSLPSDDDGDWDEADLHTEPTFRDILTDSLMALSAIVAGGMPSSNKRRPEPSTRPPAWPGRPAPRPPRPSPPAPSPASPRTAWPPRAPSRPGR